MTDSLIFVVIQVALIIVSVVLHEMGHGRASYKLWDPTPKIQNRLSFNPKYHINPIGFVLLIGLMLWYTQWGSGSMVMDGLGILVAILFAKPVIINPSYYRNPLRDQMLVALAGPLVNIVLAFLGMILIFFVSSLMWLEHAPLSIMDFIDSNTFSILRSFCILNISLAVFNLIPIPPLDGFSVLAYFFPEMAFSFKRYNHNGMIQFIFVIILLWPLRPFVNIYISGVTEVIFMGFYGLLNHIFY